MADDGDPNFNRRLTEIADRITVALDQLIPPAQGPEADLMLLAQGNGGVFPRAAVLSTIDGYNRMALGDQRMPEFGGFLEGGTVPLDVGDGRMTPVPRPLAALVTYLETLQAE